MNSTSLYGTSWNVLAPGWTESPFLRPWKVPHRYDVCSDMDLITFHAFFNLITTNANNGNGGNRSFSKTKQYGPSLNLGSGIVSQVDRISRKAARKRTEVAFCGALKVSRDYLRPFVSELLVLLNSSLREHPHIVHLVGFEWDVQPSLGGVDHMAQIVPVIEVEYADQGTLAHFLKSQPLKKTLKLRQTLCHQVGLGLLALHECWTIHGDLKPDNILVFTADTPLGVTAKICDFSHSLIGSPEDQTPVALPGGTPPWAAPEWKTHLPVSEFMTSDTFSFGLLVWSCFSLKNNPARLLARCMNNVTGEFKPERLIDEACLSLRSISALPKTSKLPWKQPRAFEDSLGFVFRYTLAHTPKSRNLRNAVAAIDPDHLTAESSIDSPQDQILLHMLALPTRDQSQYVGVRNLHGPHYEEIPGSLAVARASVSTCQHVLSKPDLYSPTARSDAAVFMFRSYLEEYGVEPLENRVGKALEYLNTAAAIELSHDDTAVWVFNIQEIFKRLDRTLPQSLDLKPLLEKALQTALSYPIYNQVPMRNCCSQQSVDFDSIFKAFQAKGILSEMDSSKINIRGLGDDEALNRLFGTLDPLDWVSKDGDNLMHVATSCGRLDLAKSLYEEYGINLEAKNGLGLTPLWLACRYAHADFVYWLVQEGVKIEPILESYHSPLMFVLNFAKHEYEAISKALCKAGADLKSLILVDQSYAFIDMLSWAALYSNTNVVRAFLNLSPTEASCDAAMTWAAYVCHLDIFQLINEYRSSQFKVTPTPTENHIYLSLAVDLPIYARTWSYNSQFHEMIVHLIDQMEDVPTSLLSQWASGAVTGNDIESMRTLLDQPKAKSIVERRYDSKGEGVRGLLETTIIMDKKDIFDLLISRGFSVQQHSINNLFSTLFHFIALRELKHSLHFCQIVYEHGEDVNKLSGPEHSDCSAQMVAVSAGNLPVLDFLLHHGANMNGDNEWVLEELISKRSARVLPVLDFVLNHPCGPPNFTTDPSRKTTALHLAAGPRFSPEDGWQNHESLIAGPAAVLGYLLKQFSDPNLHLNAKDIAGNTALHVAAYSGCDWAVKLLLNAGADPYACNDQGLNPYDCTISKRNLGRRLSTAVSFEDFDPGVTKYAVASVKGRSACRKLLCDENGKPRTTNVGLVHRARGFLGLSDHC